MTVKYLLDPEARVVTEVHDCEVFVIPSYKNYKSRWVVRFLADNGQEFRFKKGVRVDGEKVISTFGGLEKTLNTVFKGNVQRIHLIIPPLPADLDLKSLLREARNSKVPFE